MHMDPLLIGQHIALFVDDGFESALLGRVNNALEAEGAITKILSPWRRAVPAADAPPDSEPLKPDLSSGEADARVFDAVILLGSQSGADHNQMVLADFLVDMQADGKPIGSISQGARLLVGCGLVSGRTLTSAGALADCIRAGGGNWVDQAVVVDRNLVTSRTAEDVDAFNEQVIAVTRAHRNELLKSTPGALAVGLAAS